MKSPFPGMDPYLEQHWRDVHHNLITFAQGALNEQLPAGLIARVEERVFLASDEGFGRSLYPDIRVVEQPRNQSQPTGASATLTMTEPATIQMPREQLTEGFVEIIDVASGNRVVTVIEVLSLANKTPGHGQLLFLQKQQELWLAQTSLVEMDLLRSGRRCVMVPPERLPGQLQTTYCVCVHRGWKREQYEYYGIGLRDPLPPFRVPLRESDPDAVLALQPLLDQCYRNGRYAGSINYAVEPEPPLAAEDAKWADELLRGAGKRG